MVRLIAFALAAVVFIVSGIGASFVQELITNSLPKGEQNGLGVGLNAVLSGGVVALAVGAYALILRSTRKERLPFDWGVAALIVAILWLLSGFGGWGRFEYGVWVPAPPGEQILNDGICLAATLFAAWISLHLVKRRPNIVAAQGPIHDGPQEVKRNNAGRLILALVAGGLVLLLIISGLSVTTSGCTLPVDLVLGDTCLLGSLGASAGATIGLTLLAAIGSAILAAIGRFFK